MKTATLGIIDFLIATIDCLTSSSNYWPTSIDDIDSNGKS